MTFDVDYYFEDIEKEEVIYEVLTKIKSVLDIFDEATNKIINQIEASGKQQIETTQIDENVKITGNVYIGEGTKIQRGCIIHGPVYIGKNCTLMYNSYVRPGTIMEDNCVVGFSSEIKHTIMRTGSKISDLAFVGDSIMGANSRIGSGTIVANRAFSQSNVIIKDEEKNKIDLGREAFGIVLGDNSRIGSNCTVSPGTFVGKYSWVYPHTCIHNFIPELKKVYDKQNLVFVENEKKKLYKATDWNYGKYT
jgi:NDP-sugar pyrophosphorylase family protein